MPSISADILQPVRSQLSLFESAYAGQFLDRAIPDREAFFSVQGKRLRPILFFLSQGLVGKPKRSSVPLAVMIELLHDASLIHDDVVDGSERRRGTPSFFVRNGSRLSVLTGDYLLAKALSMGVSAARQDVFRIVSRTILFMTRGELVQNALEHSNETGLDQYYQVIREKTASLFAASCELAGCIQDASKPQRNRLGALGNAFGMGFQIRDDILDFTGDQKRMGKPTGIDLRNGQKTLPILLAMEKISPKEKRIVLKKNAQSSRAGRKWITEFIKERNGVGRSIDEAERWMRKARRILFDFPPSVYRRSLTSLLDQQDERSI